MEEETNSIKSVFYKWWAWVHDVKNDGKNANRGDLAKLRRLDLINGEEGREIDIIGARSIAAYRTLYRQSFPLIAREYKDGKAIDSDTEGRLIIAAYALSWIREDDKSHATLGHKIGGIDDEARLILELRFLRLIRAKTNADLFDEARRMCRLMGGLAPVESLAMTLFQWNKDQTRRKLSEDYYHLNSPTLEA